MKTHLIMITFYFSYQYSSASEVIFKFTKKCKRLTIIGTTLNWHKSYTLSKDRLHKGLINIQ